jgi:hypothetical protein
MGYSAKKSKQPFEELNLRRFLKIVFWLKIKMTLRHSIPYCYLLRNIAISHFTSKKTAAMMLFQSKQKF